MKFSSFTGLVIFFLVVVVGGSAHCPARDEDKPFVKYEVIANPGGNVAWSHKRNLVAFDRQADDDYYDLYIMKPDGSGKACVNCYSRDLPRRNIGQPAWSPDGKWLVFQAQKEDHPFTFFGVVAHPSGGIFNDLWVMEYDTGETSILRKIPADKDHGTLRPYFSPDGGKISWSEMYKRPSRWGEGREVGYWKLMVADFVTDKGDPRLANIKEFKGPGPGFYENHGFTPDGQRLIFTSNYKRQEKTVFWSMDVCILDIETGKIERLTDSGFNEHARFTPDGKKIFWSRSETSADEGMDYWIMNPDGTGRKRLTYFNDKNHPQYNEEPFVAGDFEFGPDGRAVISYCHDGWKTLKRVNERIIKIQFPADQLK